MHISLIVAVADNGVIGHKGRMPWSMRSDMKFFRQTTTNKPVIMGRKTWMSLKGPLVNRDNIVLTKDAQFTAEGAFIVHKPEQALEMAGEFAQIRSAGEVMIMGGAQIYALYMAQATRIYVTEVHMQPDGDTFFPQIDQAVWQEIHRETHTAGKKDDADYSFVKYEKKEQRAEENKRKL